MGEVRLNFEHRTLNIEHSTPAEEHRSQNSGVSRRSQPTARRPQPAVWQLARSRPAEYDVAVKLNRQVVTKSALREHVDDNYVSGSIEERVLMVWTITREVAALSPQHDVERRLQRDVVRVVRRGR